MEEHGGRIAVLSECRLMWIDISLDSQSLSTA